MPKKPEPREPSLVDVIDAVALHRLESIHTADPEAQVLELREVLHVAFGELSLAARKRFFNDTLVASLLQRLRDFETKEHL
jgi:hypothetical protein